LEPTHSKYLPPHFTPVCSAHELCHVKGFGKENEANFISSLALSQSSDPLLRFSAYDDMISYIQTQWEDAAESIINEMRQRGDTRVPELPQIHSDMTAEEKAAFRAAMEEYKKFEKENIGQIPSYSERANKIINNAYEIHNEVYNADSHPISESETMQETVQSVSESYWDIYEDHMQENSYDGVVLLLLQYYDGKLY
jgi:hypothetical protein